MGWSINHPVGLIYYSPMLSYKGYTLVSSNTADFAVLVDMEGRICHRWDYHGGIAYGKLLLNGNLLHPYRARPPTTRRHAGWAAAPRRSSSWIGTA